MYRIVWVVAGNKFEFKWAMRELANRDGKHPGLRNLSWGGAYLGGFQYVYAPVSPNLTWIDCHTIAYIGGFRARKDIAEVRRLAQISKPKETVELTLEAFVERERLLQDFGIKEDYFTDEGLLVLGAAKKHAEK